MGYGGGSGGGFGTGGGAGAGSGGGKKKQWFEGGYGPQPGGAGAGSGGGKDWFNGGAAPGSGGAGGGGAPPNPFGKGQFGGGAPLPGPNDVPDPVGVNPMVEGMGTKLKGVTDSWAGQADYNPDQPMYQQGFAENDKNYARQMRGQQNEYNAWLKNAAMGNGPSVAQEQLSQGRDAAIAAAASQAASARGGNAALANRTATQAGANLNMQAARDAAALRAQEQMGYANQWGQGLQAERAQDLMGRGQSIDEAKAQLAAETAYQQNKAQIAAGNAERGQGIFGEVLGGTGGGVFGMVPGMGKGGFTLPSDERAKVITNPGQPSITTGGAMQPAAPAPSYSEQFAGIGKAYDEGKLGKTAQQQADEAETRRGAIQGIGQGMSNAKSDHGVGLVTSLIGMISDERAKTISPAERAARTVADTAESAMGEYVRRGSAGPAAEWARRGTDRVSSWLFAKPATMQTGAVEGARYGTERASGAAAISRMSPEERTQVALATRDEQGRPGTGDAHREYARKAAEWRANIDAAKRDEERAWSDQARYEDGEKARVAMRGKLQGERGTISDTGAKMFNDSDERAKVPSLGGTESGDDFNQAANARMGEDQDKAIEEALLRAGLDRVEREATVDGGLRAGKTNVARFENEDTDPELLGRKGDEDGTNLIGAPGRAPIYPEHDYSRPPTARFSDVEPLVREMAAIPDTSWKYKPEFAEETNKKMGLPPGDPFGHAEKTSATTQAYEQVPATRGAVMHDPQTGLGKLDGGQLASTAATGVGAVARQALELDKRTRALEQALRRVLGGRG